MWTSLILAATLAPSATTRKMEDLSPPGTRPFRMGFTPWPSDLSIEGMQQSEKYLASNGDLFSLMLIGGIPWDEALAGKPYSADVERTLSTKPPKGQQLFLSISPLGMDRATLAPAWGERDNMPLSEKWKSKPFDDPEVIKAFTRFCLDATQRLKPDALAIGVESNALLSFNPNAWPAYKRLHRAAYQAIKKAHPRLPVFLTTEVNHYLERATEAKGTKQKTEVADLMRSSDWFAMSYYPHMSYDTVWPIPATFFDFARGFGKPVAVSETGMTSQPVAPSGIPLDGSPAKQDQYYQVLLDTAQKHRYKFVVTFATTDFDRLIPKLPESARELAKIWMHCGLQSGSGEVKPAGKRWNETFRQPLNAPNGL
ncbi:MAG: arabinogalactan endo-1,4-beta-galactosidase [Armatimonadetes bacterium]|nr:arabinogalactan endo-1,4-beta-galactosidase [Armatimonadota bacterium]